MQSQAPRNNRRTNGTSATHGFVIVKGSHHRNLRGQLSKELQNVLTSDFACIVTDEVGAQFSQLLSTLQNSPSVIANRSELGGRCNIHAANLRSVLRVAVAPVHGPVRVLPIYSVEASRLWYGHAAWLCVSTAANEIATKDSRCFVLEFRYCARVEYQ